MIFSRELLCECVQEAQTLLEAHHREMGTKYLLDPQWSEYALLERLGRFVIFTGREDGRLVAYSAFHEIRHLHSRNFMQAMNDCFYFDPEYRRGTTVLRFLKHCHEHLKADGANQIAYLTSPHNNLAPLLHILGFEDEQTMVAKMA